MLATLVGVAVFLVLNLVVIKFFNKNRQQLATELAAKAGQIQQSAARISEKDVWAERDAWLKKTQPKLENEGKAAVNLNDEINEVAKKTNVQLQEPRLGTVARNPQYVSVFVEIDAKATKEALRDFLYEMQSPERSVVFETANLQFDRDDKTQMYGKFRIAKWFALK